MFLFAMGAAIPIALGKRIEHWDTKYSLELDFYPSFDLNVLKDKELMIDIAKILYQSMY